jgi:hypothetical protein
MQNELAQIEVVQYTADMPIMATLRTALAKCGETRYAVSAATGIPESTLSRFIHGKPLRGENVDRLCEYLGLRLIRVKGAERKKG